VGAEPKTIGTADLKHINYDMTLLPLEWQTQPFIQTTSFQVDPVATTMMKPHHRVVTYCLYFTSLETHEAEAEYVGVTWW